MNDVGSCTAASFLYDGGWRAADRGELQAMYRMSDEETDAVCAWLRVIEEDEA